MSDYPSLPPRGFGYTPYDYFFPEGLVSLATRTPSVKANVVAWPFFISGPATLEQVRMWLVTAQTAAAARAGIYSNNNARPANLIADLGEKALATGGGAAVSWDAAAPVDGWVWVLIWLKHVATQVSVTGPGDLTNTVGGFPAMDVFLEFPSFRSNLYLEAAYPGSMPAVAPAVVPSFEQKVPMPIIRLI